MSEEASTPLPKNVVPQDCCGGNRVDYSPHFVHHKGFPTLDAAIEWAKSIAAGLGFFLVIASHKQQRDGRVVVYLACDRGGKKKTRDMETAKRKNTKRKAIGCGFKIKVTQRRGSSGMWFILTNSKTSTHNHELVVHQEGHRQMIGLSAEAKKLVCDMTEAQAKPCDILAAVKAQFPNENPNKRHIYNCRDRFKKSKSEGTNIQPLPVIHTPQQSTSEVSMTCTNSCPKCCVALALQHPIFGFLVAEASRLHSSNSSLSGSISIARSYALSE
ncbi:hypothetical protein RDABS01_039598 [Bienertia sinuspersici]